MRWWTYQKERFPLLQHGPLVAAFSSSAVAFSALQTNTPAPPLTNFLVAFTVCLIFFLQLRIADEFKDIGEDTLYRPYRPVPRGLVSLKELGYIFALGAAIQLTATILLAPKLIILLVIAWTYLALMSVEFFARDWLKSRPITYLWTHMLIMPIVDYFATACHWLPAGQSPQLAFFLTASFANGLVIEIGRKLRNPKNEQTGVPTYTKLWGTTKAPYAWLACLITTLIFGAIAAHQIHFLTPALITFTIIALLATAHTISFTKTQKHQNRFELLAATCTLALYLTLGLIPLLLK